MKQHFLWWWHDDKCGARMVPMTGATTSPTLMVNTTLGRETPPQLLAPNLAQCSQPCNPRLGFNMRLANTLCHACACRARSTSSWSFTRPLSALRTPSRTMCSSHAWCRLGPVFDQQSNTDAHTTRTHTKRAHACTLTHTTRTHKHAYEHPTAPPPPIVCMLADGRMRRALEPHPFAIPIFAWCSYHT